MNITIYFKEGEPRWQTIYDIVAITKIDDIIIIRTEDSLRDGDSDTFQFSLSALTQESIITL